MNNFSQRNLQEFSISMYESSPDLERKVTSCNSYTKNFFKVDQQNDIKLIDFIAPQFVESVNEEISLMMRLKRPIEIKYKIITAEHEEQWVVDKISPILDSEGNIESFQGVIDDITLNKKAEDIM